MSKSQVGTREQAEQEAAARAEIHKLDFKVSAQLASDTKHAPPVILPPPTKVRDLWAPGRKNYRSASAP